MLKAVTTKQH